MSKINAVRFINLNYNNNAMKINDECMQFSGKSTLLSLRNGGGKTVLVQMMTAPFVHRGKQKTKDRPFESYFTTAKPSFILVEWLLDGGGDAGIMEIARRSRGTPRIANRMLKRVRDYAQVRGGGVISLDVAREAIAMQGVDELGLDKVDRAVLGTMMDKFGGGPVGLDTLAATTGEDAVTIEDVYEPYLMQLGFLMRTPRGRMCTPAAWEHMKRTPPGQGSNNQLKMEL